MNEYHQAKENLAYTSQGQGEAVLLVHGTPGNSREWLKTTSLLKDSFQLFMPDHLGFGNSGFMADRDYSLTAHTSRLQHFVEKYMPRKFHLVTHDFGGPIGLSLACTIPDRILSVTALNTWAWDLAKLPSYQRIGKIIGGPIGKFLYRQLHFSVNVLFRNSFSKRTKLPRKLFQEVKAVHDTPEKRMVLYSLAKSLTGDPAFFATLESNLVKLQTKPWLIGWGMKDRFLTADPLLTQWKEKVPRAKTVTFPEAGHYPQLECPEYLARELKTFWSE